MLIDMNVVDDTGHSSIAHELHPDVNGSTFSAVRTEEEGTLDSVGILSHFVTLFIVLRRM